MKNIKIPVHLLNVNKIVWLEPVLLLLGKYLCFQTPDAKIFEGVEQRGSKSFFRRLSGSGICNFFHFIFIEAGRDKLCECEIAVSISNLLGTVAGEELQDSILELLANLAESGTLFV